MKKCLALILVLLMTFTLVSVLASCEGTEVETNPETEGGVTDPAEDPTDDVETEPNADDVTDSVENTEGSDSEPATDSATDSDEKATESDGEQTTDSDDEKTTDSDGETDSETDKSDAIAFEGMTVVAINQMQDIASGLAKDLSAVTGCNIKYGTYASGAQIKLVTTSTSGTGIGAAYTVKYSSSTLTLSALNKVTLAYAISDFVARIKSGLEITEGFEESYALEVKTVAATDTKLFKYCGTWQATDKNNPETMVSYWDAAYVEVDFTGSAITLTFSSATTFKYSIDGGSYVTASNVTGDYTVYAGNGGTHTVRVLTDTQANNIHFAGVKAEKNVTLSRTADKKYYIQFVGDSISDDIRSFSHNSPEILGWDYSVTACWAISMVRDWGSWKVMNGYKNGAYTEGSMAWYLNKNFGTLSIGMEDAFFKLGIPHQLADTDPRFADYAENYFTEKYDHDFNTGNTPDIVFIFLGTNDLGFTSGQGSIDKFKDRYKNFVANIFELYGDDTQIVVMQAVSTSKEGSDLYNTDCGRYEGIRQTADELIKLYPENVRFLDEDTLLSWNVEISSDNTHPSANGYNTLSTKIAEWLDEEFVTLKPSRPVTPDDGETETETEIENPTEEKCELLLDASYLANSMYSYFNNKATNFQAGHTLVNDEEIPFARFTGGSESSTSQVFLVRNYWEGDRCLSNGNSANVKDAYLLVVKMRTNTAERVQIIIGGYKETSSDPETKGTKTSIVLQTVASDSKWTTYVIDLSALVPSWKADANGDYMLHNFYFHIVNHASTDMIDVAYVAFCDSWQNVADFTGEDTVTKITSTAGATLTVNAATGDAYVPEPTPCEHEYKRETINNDLVITCTKGCGYKYEYKVDSTAALNFWNAENLGAWSNISGKIDYTTHFELNGPQYSRFTNVRASSNQMGLNAGKSGERYLIIKIRVGENGLGQTCVQLYAPSNLSSSQNYGNAGLQIKVSEDGQWHTIVVDLAERVASGGYNIKDGGYDLSTVYIRPFGNKQSAAVGNTDVYVDMAYLAICDSLSDVAKLVGGDTYEWSVSSTANEIRNTADLPTGGDDPEPPTQTETKTETETETETEKEPEKLNIPAVEPSKGCAKCNVKVTQNGNKYTWKCAVCNTVYDEMTLSDAVNYYTAVGQFNTSAWAATVSNRIYADGDVLYQRFSITNHGGTIPLVTSGNVKNGYLVDSKGGNGRYFVFKMRTVNVEALAWRITATTASGTATDPSGNYLARREAMPEGEWVVYVVDIAALLETESKITTYGTAGNADLTKIAAGFMYGHNMGGTVTDTYLDIAYFAVCDNWEEIESVVGDEKVILTNWKSSTSDKKLSSKGELPVDTKGDDAAKVIFSKTGNKMQIYLRSPDAEKYTKYDFIYIENASRKFASWKLESIEICDSDLNKLYNTMVGDSTECEGALQERYADGSLASDFIGGYHGDEKLKKITVFIDGIELDMSKDYDLTACESVQTIVESELFSCDTTNKVFDRVRTNTWTKDGLEIKNKYTATAKITINRPETSMLAISLDYGEYKGLITEHWDNVHNEWIEIGEFNVSEGRYSASGMTEAKMRGLLNVSVSAYDCTFNGQALTPTGHFSYNYFSEDNMRVKIYIAPFSNRTFAVGDVFESTSFQSVFAAE